MIAASLSFSVILYFTEYQIAGYLSIICLIAYVIAFEIGLGPISWLMMAEISPSSHRAQIVSIATFVNWGSNLLIAQFSADVVVYAQYFPFAIVCALGALFTLKIIPETKGKTEAEIQDALLPTSTSTSTSMPKSQSKSRNVSVNANSKQQQRSRWRRARSQSRSKSGTATGMGIGTETQPLTTEQQTTTTAIKFQKHKRTQSK